MSAATELDRTLGACFAPDTATAMRLCSLVDDAARRLAGDEAARDAYDVIVPDATSIELHDAVLWADGELHGLAEALGLLLDRDPLTIRTEAFDRAVDRRATARQHLAEVVGIRP